LFISVGGQTSAIAESIIAICTNELK
jgi:hypothetical protein